MAAQGEGQEDTHQHELVIIRRRGGGEDAPHKGGVWKIAHADFMTALMAFFLVMWLINATDDKTVAGIANYFNPIRLTDQTGKPKGVFTMEPGADADKSNEDAGKAEKPSKSKQDKTSEKRSNEESALFNAPYETLDKLAAQVEKGKPNIAPTEKVNTPAHKLAEAFRDPFDPDQRYDPLRPDEAAGAAAPKAAETAPAAKVVSVQPQAQKSDEAVDKAALGELQRPIEDAVKKSGFDPIPGVEVRGTDDGLLISITDQPNFAMFDIASARPKPEVVVLVEKIGEILRSRPEHIVIRGHTDGRPFRSADYDNWRLSSSRAQMAYYMLRRSGIPDSRIDRIEGHADHDLKIAGQPFAAENRRIEILVLRSKP